MRSGLEESQNPLNVIFKGFESVIIVRRVWIVVDAELPLDSSSVQHDIVVGYIQAQAKHPSQSFKEEHLKRDLTYA